MRILLCYEVIVERKKIVFKMTLEFLHVGLVPLAELEFIPRIK